jgi:hypothetical protein
MNRRDALKKSALFSAYAFSAGTVSAILSGCSPDTTQGKVAWKPKFLSAEQNDMLIRLVDTILPKSDTPSASDVGVHRFIDELMATYCPEEEQSDLKAGLDKAIAANPTDMIQYMTQLAKEAEVNDNTQSELVENYQSREFFRQLKSLAMLGYYTSEEIGTEVLAYDPVPGPFIGCYPLKKTGGRAWTL